MACELTLQNTAATEMRAPHACGVQSRKTKNNNALNVAH